MCIRDRRKAISTLPETATRAARRSITGDPEMRIRDRAREAFVRPKRPSVVRAVDKALFTGAVKMVYFVQEGCFAEQDEFIARAQRLYGFELLRAWPRRAETLEPASRLSLKSLLIHRNSFSARRSARFFTLSSLAEAALPLRPPRLATKVA